MGWRKDGKCEFRGNIVTKYFGDRESCKSIAV